MNRYGCLVVVCLVLMLALSSCTCPPPRSVSEPPLAILGAFEREITLLEGMVDGAAFQDVEGIRFASGHIEGRPVVVAWTGVGKVNAAMTTTLLIEHFRPRYVILTGIAGAVDPNLEPGDIVIGRRTAHHDMGILWSDGVEHGGVKSRLTGQDNPTFFPADAMLLAAAQQAATQTAFDAVALKSGARTPRVLVGTIVTGDTFVASQQKCTELAEKLEADAVEMEGAAVAQVCYQRGIGCLVIRSMADKADESAVVDKQRFYEMAAANSAHLVATVVRSVPR